MIKRLALLCVLACLALAGATTEPLQVSLAQQVSPTPLAPQLRAAIAPGLVSSPASTWSPTPIVSPSPSATLALAATATATATAAPPPPTATPSAPPFVIPTLIHTPTRTPVPTASSTPTPTLTPAPITTPAALVLPTLIHTPSVLAGLGLPPQLSAVSETSITGSSVTITWTTDVPSTSEVDYGTGSGLTRSPVDPSLVTDHALVLTGLSAATPYAYRVRSVASAGAFAISDPSSFSTLPDAAGPGVNGVSVQRVTARTALLGWTAASGLVAQVEYGPTANYGAFTLLKVFDAPAQMMLLSGLQPGTRYHFRVKTWDAGGMLSASGDFVFKTSVPGFSTLAGDQTLYAGNVTLVSGQAAAYQYTASQSGQANVVRLYVDAGTTATLVRVALYADQVNSPGTILAHGSGPGLSPGWISINIPAVGVMQGHTYWLSVLGPVGGGNVSLRGALGGGNALLTPETSLAAFPVLWTAGGSPAVKSHISASLQQVPPAVTLIAPTNSATVGGGVPLAATVDDDAAVSRVQFFVDGLPIGQPLMGPPYSTTWDTGTLSPTQAHTLTASASDALGRSRVSEAVTVQVDNGPTISAVDVSAGLTTSSVRVTWTTEALADSQVEFGTTDQYGLATPVDARQTWNHQMQVTGLAPGTVYHYRVKSRDAGGALAVSADQMFATAQP